MNSTRKQDQIEELISAFRASGNADTTFDNLAAERLGVNRTDLQCLSAIQNSGGLTAGRLAAAVGLTTGAVTGITDRLERAGFVRRVRDADDRRRVMLEVTPKFYARAEPIWGPLRADWEATMGSRFTIAELTRITEFLELTGEIAERHLERLSENPATPR